jgi:mevalonate kinase
MNASGHGKIILFGEHFVVHGLPSIVAALSQVTTANLRVQPEYQLNNTALALSADRMVRYVLQSKTLTTSDRCIEGSQEQNRMSTHTLVDNRPKIPNFKSTKTNEYLEMVNAICKHLEIKQSLEITLGGDLVVTSGGIGASAAAATAIVKILNSHFKLSLTNEQIFYAALEGEKAVHGNPSGIDNMAAMRGDVFTFKKNLNTPPTVEQVKFTQPLHIVLIDSGVPADTKKAITKFKEGIGQNPQMLVDYEKIFTRGRDALILGDLESLSQAINSNHELLKTVGVSNFQLDNIVTMSLAAGAMGAKLTGSGLGGLVLALAKDKPSQNKIFASLQSSGFFVQKLIIK